VLDSLNSTKKYLTGPKQTRASVAPKGVRENAT